MRSFFRYMNLNQIRLELSIDLYIIAASVCGSLVSIGDIIVNMDDLQHLMWKFNKKAQWKIKRISSYFDIDCKFFLYLQNKKMHFTFNFIFKLSFESKAKSTFHNKNNFLFWR